MKLFNRISIVLFGMVMIGLILGCQNNPLSPTTSQNAGSVRLVKASPEVLGLAKGSLSLETVVTAQQGAVLGIQGNYINIPAGALEKDMHMTFTISITSDNELQFQVEGEGVQPGENIYFQDGKLSTVAVSKDWLAAAPNTGINVETLEQYSVRTTPTHYIFQVPHFTAYGWGIAD